mmetsp:Transcript_44848/g.73043  ORF Transcript_44848/g.73043 Transcript_44848/m.73043 type:complete len:189 (+) Transcript_44848:195-761(+)|eukprot:CAMPEP_0184649082 /NCGR_PEP_ID=MMETSP0308-20130426/6339_1 /TAXON_ID=38269 /ORGANISM="Gloeochaete witrockiana, Strain SAG 46.84" /LENGTH=188 /DNA_ID=CAMNT_0027081483 /DNA_START=190 /DNA_END=756 /DNA_ORIENTATION=+
MNALSAIVQHLQHGLEKTHKKDYHLDDDDHLSHVEGAAPTPQQPGTGKEIDRRYTTEGVVQSEFARRYSGSFMLMGERRHDLKRERSMSETHKDEVPKTEEKKLPDPLPVLDEHIDSLKDLMAHHPQTGSAAHHHLPMSYGPVAEDYQRRYKGSYMLVSLGERKGERRGSVGSEKSSDDSGDSARRNL